jgi:hypothetical protein
MVQVLPILYRLEVSVAREGFLLDLEQTEVGNPLPHYRGPQR